MNYDESKHARDGGGKFSATAHDEADVDLSVTAQATPSASASVVPAWGDPLDRQVAETLDQMATDFDGEDEYHDLINVIDIGEDDLVEVYGKERSDWIGGATVEILGHQRGMKGFSSFTEWSGTGEVFVYDQDRNVLASSLFDPEDGIEKLPTVSELCPADGADDPRWGVNKPAGPNRELWVSHGISDPAQVANWRLRGFSADEAGSWAASGADAESAMELRSLGFGPDSNPAAGQDHQDERGAA